MHTHFIRYLKLLSPAMLILINPCLHAGILVLQQYRAGVNSPKLTLLYTIGTGSARATRLSRSIGKGGEGVGGARK